MSNISKNGSAMDDDEYISQQRWKWESMDVNFISYNKSFLN